jgi:hypothetical protein
MTEVKYRADVTGAGELVWSTNSMEYDTPDEAKAWLDGLAVRWTGYDAARVVTTDTPRGEAFDSNDDRIYQNFKK